MKLKEGCASKHVYFIHNVLEGFLSREMHLYGTGAKKSYGFAFKIVSKCHGVLGKYTAKKRRHSEEH